MTLALTIKLAVTGTGDNDSTLCSVKDNKSNND